MSNPAVLPPPVFAGTRVGVAALSGAVDPDRLDAGLRALAELGYEPVEAANLRARDGIFAGSDDQRLAAFHELAADPSLGAIVFARGGWGALRILPRLDWALLARHPRAYVGYSDLTPFLLAVVARLGLVAFHGPMVAADLARGLDAAERESFVDALRGVFPSPLAVAAGAGGEPVEGPFLGGCLSLLTAVLGTPFATDFTGAILFLEDLDEPLYRFDRMLTHLWLSGTLETLKGMVVGHLEGEDAGADAASVESLLERLRDLAGRFSWPLVQGLAAGHRCPNLTLPIGSRARLEPAAGRLTFDPIRVY